MTYELAKQLKDAGFPQVEVTPSRVREAMDYEEDSVVTYPTLSELINSLPKTDKKQLSGSDGGWSMGIGNLSGFIDAFGVTPEEAVAKLWLALNEVV